MSMPKIAVRLGAAVRPIVVGPGLLTHLDPSKRDEFLAGRNAVVAPARSN
jgi:hypothetical protein